MQSSTTVLGVSLRQKPRIGQRQSLEMAADKRRLMLSVKLPTGYGKTYVAAGIYSILKHFGRVNRLLVIVASESQRDQFLLDFYIDMQDSSVEGPLKVMDVSFFGAECIKEHRNNACQVFVITIQSLLKSRGADNVRQLMTSGSWMVAVDEHHHYGERKEFGKAVLLLNRSFLLAMSATPSRSTRDGAFGSPDIAVTYKDAVDENAVKKLRGHCYDYRVDIVDANGEEKTFTTGQFTKELNTDDPEKIEKIMIERKMRWSPKYVSPLVSIPIERMLRERIATGYRLQVLISAMCVSHAELICEQLRTMFPELSIDWVGTGENGRSDDENRKIIKAFCPEKDPDTRERPPSTIDVLVHVGMAGERLDSIFVSEIVFLRKASLNNQTLQIIGRASRYLPDVTGNVSFDASSELGKYTGRNIELAMDTLPPKEDEPKDDPPSEWPNPLPDEPTIHIFDMELLGIDSGDPSVQRMAKVLEQLQPQVFNYANLLADLENPQWSEVINVFRGMRKIEAKEMNPKAVIAQWDQAVESAVSAVRGVVCKILSDKGRKIERGDHGKIKTSINRRTNADMEGSLNVAYQAIRERIANGGPPWTPKLKFHDKIAEAARRKPGQHEAQPQGSLCFRVLTDRSDP